MKQDILRQYKALRVSLNKERAKLQTRLANIQAALGGEAPASAPAVEAKAPARRKRRLSPANKAKLMAGLKARWARWRAERAGKGAPKSVGKARKYFSPAARAALSAAAKARWARVRAAGKTRL